MKPDRPYHIVRLTLLRDKARLRSLRAVAHSLERLHAYRKDRNPQTAGDSNGT